MNVKIKINKKKTIDSLTFFYKCKKHDKHLGSYSPYKKKVEKLKYIKRQTSKKKNGLEEIIIGDPNRTPARK